MCETKYTAEIEAVEKCKIKMIDCFIGIKKLYEQNNVLDDYSGVSYERMRSAFADVNHVLTQLKDTYCRIVD